MPNPKQKRAFDEGFGPLHQSDQDSGVCTVHATSIADWRFLMTAVCSREVAGACTCTACDLHERLHGVWIVAEPVYSKPFYTHRKLRDCSSFVQWERYVVLAKLVGEKGEYFIGSKSWS